MLKEQEQVMDSIENKLQIVDANNKKSAHIVKAMGSTWGYIKNLFGVGPKDYVGDPAPEKLVQQKIQPETTDWNVVDNKGNTGLQPLTMQTAMKHQDSQIDTLLS